MAAGCLGGYRDRDFRSHESDVDAFRRKDYVLDRFRDADRDRNHGIDLSDRIRDRPRDVENRGSLSEKRLYFMAGPGRSMLSSLLLFVIILSLLEMYSGKLASSEWFTILGGFISSILFLLLLTFIGNYQESNGSKTGWGAVALAEIIALIAAATVHRVCVTTWKLAMLAIDVQSFLVLGYANNFLFSAGLLYEVNKLSAMTLARSESKVKRY